VTRRILVIDDEPEIAKVLEIRLTAIGYEPIIAVDGEDGWNKVKTERPDLIILDIMLPKLDGYSLCSLIKKDKKARKIPVIMLTGKNMLGDIEKGFDTGAVSYISKPYEWDRLLEEIKRFI
jgi:DNA-binding response OmpR family regulator